MDTNGDGHIDETEGLAIGRKLSGGNVELAAAFWRDLCSNADTDRSGTVTLDEYLQFSRSQTATMPVGEVVSSIEITVARLEEAKGRELQQTQRGGSSSMLPGGGGAMPSGWTDTALDRRELQQAQRGGSGSMPGGSGSMPGGGGSMPGGSGSMPGGGGAMDSGWTDTALDRTALAKRVFRFVDVDHDGVIELHELMKLARSDEEELFQLPQLFTIMDMDGFRRGDGKLTLDEWLALAEDMTELTDDKFEAALVAVIESSFGAPGASAALDRAQRAAAIFSELDTEGNGQIHLAAITRERAGGDGVAEAELADMDAASWSSANGMVAKAEWVQHFVAASAPLSDGDFEVRCRKLVRHLRGPPDFNMRIQKAKELFDALDIDHDGHLVLHEVLRLNSTRNSSSEEALPLFFAHLDSGATSNDDANDGIITKGEWNSGFLGSMAHKTDSEFFAVCDGMLQHLATTPLALSMTGVRK